MDPFTIAALASAGSGLISAGLNTWSQRRTNERNEALMRESWAREDNAVQRRVDDLRAAGINPVMAAGSAAQASGPIRREAPQFKMGDAMQGMLAMASLAQAKAQIGKTNAEAEGQRLTNTYLDRSLTDRVRSVSLLNEGSQLQNELTRVNTDIAKWQEQWDSMVKNLRVSGAEADARVAEADLRKIEAMVTGAFRSGQSSVRIPIATPNAYSSQEGIGGGSFVTVDLTSLRTPAQADLAGKELYLEQLRKLVTLLEKDINWYGVKAFTSAAGSAARSVVPFMP